MKKKLIIAGNYRQAVDYAQQHNLNPSEWMYVDDEAKLRGLRNVEVVRTGEYWKNPINNDEYLNFVILDA